MFQLVHPYFLYGMSFLAVPVLIHLINMFSHRPVPWAAMEFLLASQKKHRTWIILKQLLLLLLRMAAMALVVLALAQPLLPDRWSNLLGAQPIHHIVLLDDSYSMSDRRGGSSVFDQAKAAVERLGKAAARPRQPQSFTLLRFSRSGRYGGGVRLDFRREKVDSGFSERLQTALQSIEVSQTAAEPLPAAETVGQFLGAETGERAIIYVVSDFRTRQWDKPEELNKILLEYAEKQAEIRFIDCVEDAGRPNLSILALEPEEGIRAVNVRWRMRVKVQNFGATTARQVPVFWSADGKALPQAIIDEIPPGGSAEELFYVEFAQAGAHRIEAHLDADAVEADNSRFAIVEVPVEMPVLLVDGAGSAESFDSRRLQTIFSPAQGYFSGIDAKRIEAPAFLSRPSRPLGEFAMLSVANVDQMDRSSVEALERYASSGGGVLFVTGPGTSADFINRTLYRKGEGIFPVPLEGAKTLAVDPLDNTPDVQSEDHALFRGVPDRVGALSKVFVKQYFGVAPDWSARKDSSVRVILWLRNGAPLLVEKNFGRGRVLALLTTASSQWNNWSIAEGPGPSFVAFALNLVPYLGRRSAGDDSLQVGQVQKLPFSSKQYLPAVHFSGPGGDALSATVNGEPDGQDSLSATYAQTVKSGFYTARLTRTSGKVVTRSFAVNVDPAEGNLKALAGPDLRARLPANLPCRIENASNFESTIDESRGRNMGDALLLALVVALALEQLLAWSCGYQLSRSTTDPWRDPAFGRKGDLA